MSRILHKSFRYVNAASTDIKATFRRLERERRAKEAQDAANAAEASTKTITLPRKRAV